MWIYAFALPVWGIPIALRKDKQYDMKSKVNADLVKPC